MQQQLEAVPLAVQEAVSCEVTEVGNKVSRTLQEVNDLSERVKTLENC